MIQVTVEYCEAEGAVSSRDLDTQHYGVAYEPTSVERVSQSPQPDPDDQKAEQ
jgi:hypothetical protein